MKLPNISTQDKKKWSTLGVDHQGFTLVEILIVMTIISFIAVIGVIVSIDTYSRYIFRSDLDKVAILLQKARSSAINNVGGVSHGVYLDDNDDWILFRGTEYVEGEAFNYKIGRSKTATSTNTCGNQVVFSRLTATTTDCGIIITEGNKVATTTINNQGGINY